jgi:nicotinate-nucleotide pyrophosphorylase (carboxylating)
LDETFNAQTATAGAGFMNIIEQVSQALDEDIQTGDITANLIPEDKWGRAQILAREAAVVCGQAWVNEVFRQVDERIKLSWHVDEGSFQDVACVWATIEGPLRGILTAERTALNFLQTLSAVASKTKNDVDLLTNYPTKILDTRKTIPGLRMALKYAVRCGGGLNHRMGLYDAFLIKENHIEAMGSITMAVKAARELDMTKPIIVEVQNLDEFMEAQALNVTRIMLDNFDDNMVAAVMNLKDAYPAVIEVSGGINEQRLLKLAQLGVDFISIGGLTKSIAAIDLSLLVEELVS